MKTNINSHLTTISTFGKKKIVAAVSFFLLVSTSLSLWTGFQKKMVKSKFTTLEQELKNDAHSEIEKINKQFLRTMAKPYAWAVKQQMLQNNFDAIDLYVKTMIKAPNFISVMVIDEQGRVVSSTNKKYKGKYFISFNSPYYLQVDSTVVYKATARILTMATPIVDVEKKLGTLVINYSTKNKNLF